MHRDTKLLREAAAALVAECGPYATMAALFLASEARERGRAEDAAHWARVAGLVPELAGPGAPRACLQFCGVAGTA